MNYLFEVIKRRISNLFYNSKNISSEIKFIENVFKKSNDKHILVSYIVRPFVYGLNNTHTNLLECYTACQIFDELGYNVDVIDYNNFDCDLTFTKYDLIYGFGEPVERSLYNRGTQKNKIVIYGTGCDTVFSNRVSIERIKEFYEINNIWCVNSARIERNAWRLQILMSDKIIALGNEFVKETYRMQSTSSIDCINIFHDGSEEINLLDKDYTKSKNNFLWWGSAGAIHKGLDLLIDIFKKNKNLNLYICGYNREAPFDEFMLDEIKNCENIHNEGFVKIGSDRYFEILNLCIAVISPSISEGGAPGVVNVASAAGLIPIVTRNCGLNVLNQEFIIKEVTTQGVWESIDLLISTDIEEIKEISRETKYFFRKNHSYALYKTNLKEIITRVLDK